MTVAAEVLPISDYTGDGSTTVFLIGFVIPSGSSLLVYVGGVLKTSGVDYNITGSGADVTFTAAPAAAAAIEFRRDTPVKQLTAYPNTNSVKPVSLEKAYDLVTTWGQEIKARTIQNAAGLVTALLNAASALAIATAADTTAADALTAADYALAATRTTAVAALVNAGGAASSSFDNMAAFTALFANPAITDIDLGGQNWGVSGTINQPAMSGKTLHNGTITQLNPHVNSRRTLLIDSQTGFRIFNVTIVRGGSAETDPINPTDQSQMQDRAGAYISNCSDFTVDGLWVFGGGVGTQIILTDSTDFELRGCLAAHANPVLSANPLDDRLEGFWLDRCKRYSLTGCRARDLSVNWTGKVDALRWWSRGFAAGGNSGFTLEGCTADQCDQGFDTSGSEGCSNFAFQGCHASNCRQRGFKFANNQFRGTVSNCTSYLCALAGFGTAGPASAPGSVPITGRVTFEDCVAHNCGSGAGTCGGFINENPTTSTTNDLAYLPKRIVWRGCRAIDDRTGMAQGMNYGFFSDGPTSVLLADKALADDCEVSGSIVSDFHGVRVRPAVRTLVRATITASGQVLVVNTPAVIAFDTAAIDTQGEFNTGAHKVVFKYAGWYDIKAYVRFAVMDANVEVQLRVLKNGSGGPQSALQRAFSAGTDVTYNIDDYAFFDVADELTIEITQTGGTGRQISNSALSTYLDVAMVEAA